MAKKKRQDFSSTPGQGGFGGALADALASKGLTASAPSDDEAPPAPDESAGRSSLKRARVRHERKGRAGKTVTVVEGIAHLDDAGRKRVARAMGKALGCRGTVEGEAVVLQGDQRERAAEWLAAHPTWPESA